MKERLISFVPNIFTLGNMFCGYLSIVFSLTGQFKDACWIIILGAFFDFLDGSIARLTDSVSEVGIQLDSFADFVTFGVAPAVVLSSLDIFPFGKFGIIFGLIYLLAGAFRLSRYNVSTEDAAKDYFLGLPIPASALLLISYVLFSLHFASRIVLKNFLIGIILITSWLMVSSIKYNAIPHLSSIKGKKEKIELIFLIITSVIVLYKPTIFLFPVIFLYTIFGFSRKVKDIFF